MFVLSRSTACAAWAQANTTREIAGAVSVAAATEFSLMPVAEHIESIPAPIDAMALDKAIPDLHDLDQVHLVAVWRRAWVFPGQYAAVGEKSLLEALPLRRVGLEHFCNE